MIEPTSPSIPVGTWAKHNTTEVVRHDKRMEKSLDYRQSSGLFTMSLLTVEFN